MDGLDLEAVVRDCETEIARDSYPGDFPALPPIPAARYADPDFFRLEREHVWGKSWLLAAHESDVPQSGDYKLIEKLGESVLVIRGTDGAVRAMHNVCMHRGSPLVREPRGNVRKFVCPYHAWTYEADGSLSRVAEARNFACLDKAAMGLQPVRCETWRGHVFINFDAGAAPLVETLGAVPALAADFPFEDMEVKRHCEVAIDCNWKVALDNFIEIYHIATVHPAIMRWLEVKSFDVTPLKGGHSYLRTKRRNGNRIIEGEALLPQGDHDLFQTYAINLPMFPHVAGGLDAGGFQYTVFWPDGPDRTIIELVMYGARDKNDPEYWDTMETEAMRLVGEDFELLPGVHRALKSGRIASLPLSYHERAIYWYNEEIDRRIGRDRIDPALRVIPVLESFAAE